MFRKPWNSVLDFVADSHGRFYRGWPDSPRSNTLGPAGGTYVEFLRLL
jgi:hypothetical protein